MIARTPPAPWKQISVSVVLFPRCRFVLPTPSWHGRRIPLAVACLVPPHQQGLSKTVNSTPTHRPGTGSRRSFVQPSGRRMTLQLSHQLLTVECLARIIGMQSAQLAPWHTSLLNRCLSLSVPVWGRFAGCCTNTARCPDRALPRILLCWLDPRFGAGTWHELRHNARARTNTLEILHVRDAVKQRVVFLHNPLEVPNNIVGMYGPWATWTPATLVHPGRTTWATRSNLSHTSGLILARFHTCVLP